MTDRQSGELPPKQLSMVARPVVTEIPNTELPPGYVLRTYQPGDEKGWAKVLREAGFKDWTTQRCRDYLQEPIRRRGSHLVACGRQVAAVTFATPHADDPAVGYLDYVATHPDHRDRHLGRAVCGAVMRFFVAEGRPLVRLLTDDWRLPAIALYLSLGFEPVMTRADMPARWEAIFARLGR